MKNCECGNIIKSKTGKEGGIVYNKYVIQNKLDHKLNGV